MMHRVQLFAVARQLAGRASAEVDLPAGATVADLRRSLAATIPALADLLPGMLFAINADYAADKTVVPPNADIACIPPVSGG